MKPAQSKLFAAWIICLMLFSFGFDPAKIISTFRQKTTPITGGQASIGGSVVKDLTPRAIKSNSTKAGMIKQAPAALEPLAVSVPVAQPISPAFKRFIEKTADGQAGVVKGIFVPGVFALRVIQQPENDVAFVSDEMGTATQFRSAANHGVIGLLAHNFLSGKLFYDLIPGQEVRVVYGDGSFRRYQITSSHRFQKLTPSSLRSDFIDLQSGNKVTTNQVFNQFYKGEDHLTFQTCLEENGLSNWGLTFTIAIPMEPK